MSRFKVLYRDWSEGLAVGGCVMIQSLYHDRREVWLARRVTIQTIILRQEEGLATGVCRDTPNDTAATWLRHSVGCATILRRGLATRRPAQQYNARHGQPSLRHGRCEAYDTTPCTPRHGRDMAGLGAVRTACACKLGQGVHLVHPTQF